jgi:hypothetical protein
VDYSPASPDSAHFGELIGPKPRLLIAITSRFTTTWQFVASLVRAELFATTVNLAVKNSSVAGVAI